MSDSTKINPLTDTYVEASRISVLEKELSIGKKRITQLKERIEELEEELKRVKELAWQIVEPRGRGR